MLFSKEITGAKSLLDKFKYYDIHQQKERTAQEMS